MLQGELRSETMHAVYTAGTEEECRRFLAMLEPTLKANGLDAEVRQHYKRVKGEHQPRYSVETHMLPQVAHTVVALSQGGKVKEPISGDAILEYLRVHEGHLREWREYAERGLVPIRGKHEGERDTIDAMLYPPANPPEDPFIEVPDAGD